MLLILPIILSRISHNFLPLFFILFLLFLYCSSHLITSVTVMSTHHMIAGKWVHFTAITIIFFLILFEKLQFAFMFIISLLIDILHYIKPFLFPINKFFYCACNHPIIPALLPYNLLPIIFKIMLA